MPALAAAWPPHSRMMLEHGTIAIVARIRTYRIEGNESHTHLDYELEGDCTLCAQIGLPARGSFIVSVMNPDPTR